MNSSGIKRGLAVSAISALALSGLGMIPASAQTLKEAGVGTQVLYTPFGTANVSNKTDGTNTTVRLVAASSAANAVGIRFEKSTDGGVTWSTINTVPLTDGLAVQEYAPLAADTNVRAVAVDNTNAAIAGAAAKGVAFAAANDAITLNGATRDSLGVFPTGGGDYSAVVSGLTGDNAGVNLQNVGPVDFGASQAATIGATANGQGLYPFKGVVTIDGANVVDDTLAPLNKPNDLEDDVVIAASNGESSDAQVYKVYLQKVTNGTVTNPVANGYSANVAGDVNNGVIGNGFVDGPDTDATNDVTRYNLTVVDQFGKPVAGVPVYPSDNAGVSNNTVLRDSTGGFFTGNTTNADGQIPLYIREDDDQNAGDYNTSLNSIRSFVVVDVVNNGGNAGNFQNVGDVLVQFDQTSVPAAPTAITLANSLGSAQDDDEAGEVTITVKDSNGNPVQNVVPTVKVSYTYVDGNGQTVNAAQNYVPTATDNKGQTKIPQGTNLIKGFDDTLTNIKVEVSTTNGVAATPLLIESDQAQFVWDEGAVAQAAAGTTTTQSGKLVLTNSGAVLPGRTFALTFTQTADADQNNATQPNQPGDAGFAPTAQQVDKNTVVGSKLTAQGKTGADGSFSVTVTDPSPAPGAELNDQIKAASVALNDVGDSADGNLQLDFLRSLAPARIEVQNSDNTRAAGETLVSDGLFSTVPTFQNANGVDASIPGVLSRGQVIAFNADGVQLDSPTVNVSIDEGFFVDTSSAAKAFDGTPTQGAVVDYKSAGKSFSVTFKDGVGTFYATIERNEGFDDDGRVQDKVRATSGSASDTQDVTWTTDVANGNGSVANVSATEPISVELSEDQESTVLPKARAGRPLPQNNIGTEGQDVNLDVVTKDFWGNPTSLGLNVTDNTPNARTIDGEFDNSAIESEFDAFQPAITAQGFDDTAQTIEVEANGAFSFTYAANIGTGSILTPSNNVNPALFIATPRNDIEDTAETINWYTVDTDASTFELAQQGDEQVPAGTTVTMEATAVDQEGQALTGVNVQFVRSGPGPQDSDGNNFDVINRDGKAFYDFAGTSAGVANVSAIFTLNNGINPNTGLPNPGERIAKVDDSVTFLGNQGTVTPILSLEGTNNGNKDDELTLKSNLPQGATVELYKLKRGGNGEVLVDTAQVDANGEATFTVADKPAKKKKNRKRNFIVRSNSFTVGGVTYEPAESNKRKVK